MSRTLLIIVALVVGAVLAVGGSIATTQLVGNSTPSNQAPYNYGG
jgi:hypothetical protein